MSFFLSIRSLAKRKSGFNQLFRLSKSSEKLDGCRCFSTIAFRPTHQNQIHPFASRIGFSPFTINSVSNSYKAIQLRHFTGSEVGVLSKTYQEKRVLGYTPQQIFDVVAAVDFYHGFVPWCKRSEILKHYPDGSFDAELEIGFDFLVESYVSHVELDRAKRIKATVSQSILFDHLINIWEFSPGPVPGTCNLYFSVDFKFQSPLYTKIASEFYEDVGSKMVGSFIERCRLIYGPEVRVLETSYRHRTDPPLYYIFLPLLLPLLFYASFTIITTSLVIISSFSIFYFYRRTLSKPAAGEDPIPERT